MVDRFTSNCSLRSLYIAKVIAIFMSHFLIKNKSFLFLNMPVHEVKTKINNFLCIGSKDSIAIKNIFLRHPREEIFDGNYSDMELSLLSILSLFVINVAS